MLLVRNDEFWIYRNARSSVESLILFVSGEAVIIGRGA
jgi:hypothetical protein